MIAYCADVGSGSLRAGTFGWARVQRDAGSTLVHGGSTIEGVLDLLEGDLKKRRSFSLGIAVPEVLRSAHPRESDSVGLWMNKISPILARLKTRAPDVRVTLDRMASIEADATTVLVWEALVTGAARASADDLVTESAGAAVEFLDNLQAESLSVNAETRPAGSLLGTILVMSGFATGLNILREPTVVVRSIQPWNGPIESG